jgi:hypothetical protein
MSVNLNVEPYFDDFDESKNFHRILFKPGVAVQARELTQLQTILQKQIERFGRHVFKNGSMVIPGQLAIDQTVAAVKLQTTSVDLETVFASGNVTVTGATTGVVATVIKGISAEGSDPPTLIVRFTKEGTSAKIFSAVETLSITGSSSSLVTASADTVTNSSIASIAEGVYFIQNNFVRVEAQTIVLDKYSGNPSYRVGLSVSEEFITEEDDITLKDNAQGSYNENAPGAHRYKITLTLDKLSLTSVLDEDFVELSQIVNGVIKTLVNRTDYSVLEKTLARRTYDESGDYTVRPFKIQVREHRDNNRGIWAASKANVLVGDVVEYNSNKYVAITASGSTTGSTAPTHTAGSASDGTITWLYVDTPTYNRGVYSADSGGDTAKLAIGVEPGKAYIRGYELEKLATEYIPVSKARTTQSISSDIIATTVGSYVLVANVHANSTTALDLTNFGSINLYDAFTTRRGAVTANVIGTARVRDIMFDSGNAAATSGVFKLSLFDISMNAGKSFERNVKQLGNVNGGAAFTADISPNFIQVNGTITAAASTSVIGTGTKFLTDFIVGDWLYFDSPAAGRRKIISITSDYALTVDVAATATDSSVYRIQASINEPLNLPAIFLLPYTGMKDTTSQSYTVTKAATVTSTGGGVITISGETYNPSALAADYVVINNENGVIENPTISTTSSTITISGLAISTSHTIVYPVVKSTTAKTKTPTVSILQLSDANVFASPTISLGKADVYKIDSIKMAGNTLTVTDWFTLDDGQRPSHYDVSKLVKKPNYPVPYGNLTIQFRYYAHGTSGEYFSANSYSDSSIIRSEVPVFHSDAFSAKLYDTIDFRPRKDDTGTAFSGVNSSLSMMPRRGFQTNFGYNYYLPRKDKIAIDVSGNIFNITGAPALTPQEASDPDQGMTLYKLTYAPYTQTSDNPDVTFEYIDNKRYTMRDIGVLEKRLNQVEYYTALNLLEQETKSLTILDSDGFDRYKNGFIVDNFEGHGVGDVFATDYRCSVDMQNNQLRPFFNMENIKLVEENNENTARVAAKYQVTGDLVTLRYTSNILIIQPYASQTENVNPFSVAYFNGRMDLVPPSDEWIETQTRPDIVVNEDGNFDSVRSLAASSGVLGTIWNSWETQWTGSPAVETTSSIETMYDNWSEGDIPFNVTLQRTATQVGQARAGVRTSVVARIDTRRVGDKIVSTALIPFIRSRYVAFVARGMKPNANVYPFFDGVSVSSYVTPAAKVSISGITGTFDYDTNADTYDTEAARRARRVNNEPQPAFNRGDVVFNSAGGQTVETSNGTAVVAYVENSTSGNVLHLHNLRGSLLAGNPITGSLSGATATLAGSVSAPSVGGSLVTSVNGDVAGVFNIPNTDAIKFRTGSREFRLTDSAGNDRTYKTQSNRLYFASGTLETKQGTIISTRNAEYVTEKLTENRTIVQTTETIISSVPLRRQIQQEDDGGGDGGDEPLAQTFLIDQPGGCFVTKVDIFFATKDANLPVKIELRETVNGYPGKTVLPFGRVILPPVNVNTSTDGTTATTFTFDSPVYMQHGSEYALVILTDSFEYTVWISQVGEKMIGTDRLISSQPALGSLFKSQNASTWTADQMQDLKFTIYRAVFDIANSDASFSLVNEKIGSNYLGSNPLRVMNRSNVIQVMQQNHGIASGANVILSGFPTTGNITAADINRKHLVGNVLLDSYSITVANASSITGMIGGACVLATHNITYDMIHPMVQFQNFRDTSIVFSAYMTEHTLSASRSSTPTSILVNRNNELTSRKVIRANVNQTTDLTSDKTLKITAALASSNDSLSPVIDLTRSSAILIGNRIDNVNSSISNFGHFSRTIVNGNTSISFNGNNITTNNITMANIFSSLDVGKTLTITRASNPTNNTTAVISGVTVNGANANITCVYSFANETGANVIISVGDNHIDELAPFNGSIASKYITRQINLVNASKYVRIMFAASVPKDANIDVYYRAGTGVLGTTNWTLVTPMSPIIKTKDVALFTDVTYEIDDIPSFTTLAVKIVMRSDNTSAVPLVKDLRIIACP